MFKGVGGSVVGLTQDTLACAVHAAASAGSGFFCVTADLLGSPGWRLQTPVQCFLVSDESDVAV